MKKWLGRRRTPFFAGGLLVLFLTFILVMNYRSQIRLQESALAQLVQNLEQQAGGVSYFFSERFIDMKNLARAREANIFFENKALGMSMLYGLRASLLHIHRRFDQLIEEKRMEGEPIYSRLVFVDESGIPLSDRSTKEFDRVVTHTASHADEPRLLHSCSPNWSDFLNPESVEPLIKRHLCRGHLDILITVPYFFKSTYKGEIVSWLNCRLVNGLLVKKITEDPYQHIFIDFGIDSVDTDIQATAYLPHPEIDGAIMNRLRETLSGQAVLFELTDSKTARVAYVGVRVPIAGTPFFLTMAIPSDKVLGGTSPVHLLIAMIVLAIFVAGSALLLWRIDANALVLSTRLKEESLRKQKVEAVVQKRTLELEKAQKALLNKALDAGRAQLSAMILHNIGNAVTPVGVYMEKLRRSKMKQLNHYLLQCYKDLADHKNDLTSYVTEDPKGIKVANYMGHLIGDLENERQKASGLLNNATIAIEYVSEVLSLQRSYAPGSQEMKEKVRLNQLVKDALKIQKSTISAKNTSVVEELGSDLPLFTIEKNKLMQVVINFIKNSCDAIGENQEITEHRITLSTEYRQDKVCLMISDTGCGVEPGKLEEIFQFGVSTKGSSGFGLYYCKSFVEANNGVLTLTSPGHNLGATVTMAFLIDSC